MATAAELIAKHLEENPPDPEDGSLDMFLGQKITGLASRLGSDNPVQRKLGESELAKHRKNWAGGDGTSRAILTRLIAQGVVPD